MGCRRRQTLFGGSLAFYALGPMMSPTPRIDFEALARVRLREGAGGGEPGAGHCVMELVSWISGDDRVSDQPDCASPFLAAFAIALNDSAPDGRVRDEMKPLAFLLVDTREPGQERRRADHLRRECAHVLLAPLLSAVGLQAQANSLGDAKTLREIRVAAREAEAALSNVVRSHASANARAAARRLAEACGGGQTAQALRDCVYCALTAPADAQMRLALWRRACAILRAAIGLGKHAAAEGAIAQSIGEVIRRHENIVGEPGLCRVRADSEGW